MLYAYSDLAFPQDSHSDISARANGVRSCMATVERAPKDASWII